MESVRSRITPDLLAEVREGLQGRGVRELRRMEAEIDGVSFTWLFHVQHGSYKSEPGVERVMRVHRWLASHPIENVQP